MTPKQKKTLCRIVVSFLMTVALHLIHLDGPMLFFLYLIPYLIIGYDVLRGAFLGIIQGQVFDENFLMAIATVGAMILGKYGEGVEVMLFFQVGELFQSYAVGKSRQNIAALMDICPDYANVEQDGELVQVDPDDVEIDDIIVIRPGEKVPLDGVVLEGTSTLNTSALTGESLPKEVGPGDNIISGCVNTDRLLKVRVTKLFDDSTVSKILELVENSSLKKARSEKFITKFARYYTPAVCIAAALLAVIPPLFVGNWTEWISRALTFLVISCPCALLISIPLSFFGGIGGASSVGILVKGGNYLEALASTRTLVFDKTGTLTKGVFAVTEVCPAVADASQTQANLISTENKADHLLELAALAEVYSSHPISKSLRDAAANASFDLDTCRVSDVEEIAGHGVTAMVDGRPIAAGNARLMEHLSIHYTANVRPGTVVYVAADGKFLGSILISDQMKPTTSQAIHDLQTQGVRTVMLTGDSRSVAEAVGGELGIDEIHSELLPADKVTQVERLLTEKPARTTLAFVGDGINDAPVLSRADIGIAMGAMGSDAAIEAADIVLMDDDPAKIALAMKIARKTMSIVKQNIAFALAVKIGCLILTAIGITGMQAGIFADVGVMVIAVLNATRTLRVK
ncbi:MAG: cadmium-translocating P-type ATPase [Lachnospiraceae bacterium]|nr:cadmium-translocating P-type ATPase [Lachnospiraceae bacterium]